MHRPFTMSSLALLAGLGGCASSSTGDIAATRAALMEADRAFNRSTAERRTDGWVEYFADDGAMIWQRGTISGKAAIRKAMEPLFSDTAFTLTWEPIAADVGAGGDLGYTIGRSTTRFTDDSGKPGVRTGRYLTVWKKQPDGSWKVVQDIGVQDRLPEGAR